MKQAVTTPGSRDEAGKAGPPNIHTAVDHSSFIQSGLNDVIFEYKVDKLENGDYFLDVQEASKYRSLAAQADYLAQDRAEI